MRFPNSIGALAIGLLSLATEQEARVMDEEEYLQPDWDPNSIKVAQLRGLLLKHEVRSGLLLTDATLFVDTSDRHRCRTRRMRRRLS